MRLAAGLVCLSVVGLAEGLIALMIAPIFDRVLNPGAPDNKLLLIQIPSRTSRFIELLSSSPDS